MVGVWTGFIVATRKPDKESPTSLKLREVLSEQLRRALHHNRLYSDREAGNTALPSNKLSAHRCYNPGVRSNKVLLDSVSILPALVSSMNDQVRLSFPAEKSISEKSIRRWLPPKSRIVK